MKNNNMLNKEEKLFDNLLEVAPCNNYAFIKILIQKYIDGDIGNIQTFTIVLDVPTLKAAKEEVAKYLLKNPTHKLMEIIEPSDKQCSFSPAYEVIYYI